MEHQCLTSLLQPVSPRVSVVPDRGTSGGLSEGWHEPSPEGGIGCKELKTRTPGRVDTSPRGLQAQQRKATPAGPQGAVVYTTGGWQAPTWEIDPAQTMVALLVRCADTLLSSGRHLATHTCHCSAHTCGPSQGVGGDGQTPEKLRTDFLGLCEWLHERNEE